MLVRLLQLHFSLTNLTLNSNFVIAFCTGKGSSLPPTPDKTGMCPKRGTLACGSTRAFDQEHCLVIDYPKPAKLIFLNDGVKLPTEGSRVLDALGLLEKEGVQILSCGICLEYHDLVERLEAGLVTRDMYDIVDSLLTADKVIKL